MRLAFLVPCFTVVSLKMTKLDRKSEIEFVIVYIYFYLTQLIFSQLD
jgi:hypothetical protein